MKPKGKRVARIVRIPTKLNKALIEFCAANKILINDGLQAAITQWVFKKRTANHPWF